MISKKIRIVHIGVVVLVCLIAAAFISTCKGETPDPKNDNPPGTTKYAIEKGTISGEGNFTISPNPAAAGATVTLTAQAETGWRIKSFGIIPGTTTPQETSPGSGVFTFTMPGEDIEITAVFVQVFTITRVPSENGDFSLSHTNAVAGETITLEVLPAANFIFVGWVFEPSGGITTTDAGDGVYTFTMPARDLSISAKFADLNAASGVKTMTVVSGLGRNPGKTTGNDVYDATRHITVTTTMTAGMISDVMLGHPDIIIRHPVNGWAEQEAAYNPYKAQATALVEAIKDARDPDVSYTVSGLSGAALDGWAKHEKAIRDAVKDGCDEIMAGKPNRVLEGGGTEPWTADGELLNGEATVTGNGHMMSSGQGSGSSNLATDMTVKVVVKDGFIESVTVTGDDTKCNQSSLSNKLANVWNAAMKSGNTYIPTAAGYTFATDDAHWNSQSVGAGWGSGAVGTQVGGLTRSFRGMAGLVQMALYQICNEY